MQPDCRRLGAPVAMGYGAQYFRHTVITAVVTALNGALFYLLRVFLYRTLPAPEDYGLFYAGISFCALVYPFITVGFDPGIVPFVTRFREQHDPAAIKRLVLGSLIPQASLASVFLLVAVVFAEPIAVLCFKDPGAAALVRILGLFTCVLLFFRSGASLLLGLQYIAMRNLAELIRVASCVVLTIALLREGLGILAPAYGYLLSAALGALVEVAVVARLDPAVVHAPFRWDPGLVSEVFRNGKYLTIGAGGMVLFSQMDTVMLTLMRHDLRAVAAYQVAAPTVMILYAFMLAGTLNLMPLVTTMWHRGERALLADGIQRLYEAALAIVLPGSVVAASFSGVFLELLWTDVGDAPAAFNILAVGSAFYLTCLLNFHILSGIGRPKDACVTIVASLGANLALNLLLIHFFGIRGAAAATVSSHIIATVLGLRVIRRELRVRVRILPILAVLAACIAIVFLSGLVRASTLFQHHTLVAALVTGVILYCSTLTLFELLGIGRLRELSRIILLRPTTAPKSMA